MVAAISGWGINGDGFQGRPPRFMGETHSCSAPAGMRGTHKQIQHKEQRLGKKQPEQQGNMGQSRSERAGRSPKGQRPTRQSRFREEKHLYQLPTSTQPTAHG